MTINGIFVLILITLIHFILLRKYSSGKLLKSLSVITLIKLASAFFFTAYYMEGNSNPMAADVFKYFHDADVLYQTIYIDPLIYFKILFGIGIDNAEVYYHLNKTEFYFHGGNHWTNDDHLMIKTNMIIRLFSFGNIYIHSIVFGLISFWSSLYFIKNLIKKIETPKSLIYLSIFLIPSVLFWSSGALKETILISALLISLSILFYDDNRKMKNGLILLICIFLIFSIRPALLVSFLAGIVLSYLIVKLERFRIPIFAAIIIIGFSILFFTPEIPGLIINKRNELIETAIKVNANTLVDSKVLTPNLTEFLKILPVSFFNGLAEPVIWKTYPLSAKLFGLEMIFFFLLLLFIVNGKSSINKWKNFTGLSLVMGSLIYIFIVGLTTPVAGAITRYRSITLPTILVGIYHLFILKLFIYIKFQKLDTYFEP